MPLAAAIISGIKAEIVTSKVNTSKEKSTPAIGALKAPPIPAATPQASNNVRSFWVSLYVRAKLEPNAAPVITIGASTPADPPKPTVRELVMIWEYI